MRALFPAVAAALLLGPVSGGQAKVQVYEILPARSELAVVATQEGMMSRLRPSHRLALKSFVGRVRVPAADETQVEVELEAEAASLANVDKEITELERTEFEAILRQTVLEVGRFPKIKFRSAGVADVRTSPEGRRFTLLGDLMLHGETRRVAVPMTVVIKAGELRATGESKLKQTDFAMKPYAGGFGAIKIGDEVKVSFTVVAKLT